MLFHRNEGRLKRRLNLFETLESRTLYSVDPTITGALPVTLVATVKNTATVTVSLTNSGAATVKGPYTINFYASTDQTLDPAVDTFITTYNKSLAKTVEGASKTVKFKLGTVAKVPADGAYYILADVTGAINANVDSVGASVGTVTIDNPFVDLSDTAAISSPAAGKSILPGKPYTLTIDVTNNGNVPATGNLPIDLATSLSLTGTSPTDLITVTKHINIAPGKTTPIKLTEKVALGTAIADYYYVATVDPGNTFVDPDLTNNVAVTPTALDVGAVYPNIQQTYSGNATITMGAGTGKSGTLTVDFTNESQVNGVTTGTGTLFGEGGTITNFSINCVITTKGVITGHSLTTAGVTDTFAAKLVGDQMVGTITSSGAGAQSASFTIDPVT